MKLSNYEEIFCDQLIIIKKCLLYCCNLLNRKVYLIKDIIVFVSTYDLGKTNKMHIPPLQSVYFLLLHKY